MLRTVFQQKNSNKLIILGFTLLYLLFPTNNSTIDAYNYAANVKWNHDLFFPHHLIYNIPARIVYSFFQVFGFEIDVLQLMKIINALVAGFVLYVFVRILKRLSFANKTITGLLLISGSSFGFLRFATENEAYILPLFMSVLASYHFLLFINNQRVLQIVLSGMFASLACLFHQIHVFWFVGLLIGLLMYKVETKLIFLFILPGLFIPLVYFLAFRFGNNDFMHTNNFITFVLYDYSYGSARVNFNINNLILGVINLVRSFIQVHGIILILLKKIPVLIVAILFTVFFLLKALLNLKPIIKSRELNRSFLISHLIIFVLQFAFSVFAGGNAEFMVMLPILSLLVVAGYVKINYKFYINLGISIFIWNFSLAIIPNYTLDYNNDKRLIEFIEIQADDYFILSEDVLIQNRIYYHTSVPWNKHIIKSPAGYKINGKDQSELCSKIDLLLNANSKVYTDCIDEPIIYNRATYLSANENKDFFKDYLLLKTDSFRTFTGRKYIYKIKK